MKRMVIFIVIGLVFLAAGVGVGIYLGKILNVDSEAEVTKTPAPGPIVPAGEFTVNLAGAGNRIMSFSVSLEALNAKADDTIKNQNWMPRIRNEILLLAKDKVYEDLTKAEGVVQFGEQIKRTLNTVLPQISGEVPIVRVMFESFVLQ
ncbi:MAG: flagellar basal body-associated FliL family protein [Synergistaceae bacterium]|nr:flagellar basal body-associated FliL family protein [Synergistaceae bacterium]